MSDPDPHRGNSGWANRLWLTWIIWWRRGRRIDRRALGRVFKDALGLLFAAVLGAYVSSVLGAEVTSKIDTLMVVLLCLSALVWCLAVSVLFELNRSIQSTKNYDVFLHRDYRIGKSVTQTAFSFCAAEAMKARKSIVVMGPHFERSTLLPSGTQSHDDYLEESMNSAIDRHISNPDSDFRYERIVQVQPEAFVDFIQEEGRMEPEQFENQSLARHVKHVLELSRSAPNAEISISAIPYVPSFPSVLIIDDRFVFFSVPTGITGQQESLAGDTGRPKTNFDVVLGIEDRSGEIPTLFRKVILQFKQNGRQITSILDRI